MFDRTTRAVMLTAIGRDFARKARTLLDSLEESLLSIRGVSATGRDEVTIACVPSAVYYFLPRVIPRYQEKHPKIRIRILDEGANEALAAVVRGEADFGISIIGTQEPDIEFHALRRERFVVACHRDHELDEEAQREMVRPAGVAVHSLFDALLPYVPHGSTTLR